MVSNEFVGLPHSALGAVAVCLSVYPDACQNIQILETVIFSRNRLPFFFRICIKSSFISGVHTYDVVVCAGFKESAAARRVFIAGGGGGANKMSAAAAIGGVTGTFNQYYPVLRRHDKII